MDTDKFQKTLNETIGDIKSWFDLQTRLLKLNLFEKVARGMSTLFFLVFMVFVLFFVLLFLSLGFVQWFQDNGGDALHGYLIVAIFYLILGIFILLFRKRLFISPIIKSFSETVFEEDEEVKKTGKKEVGNEKA